MQRKFVLFVLMVLFSLSFFVGAQSTYCCEKLTSGAWCQNAPLDSCNTDFRKSPTACASTAYCKLGCCFNSQEGTCIGNSPQKICEDSDGVWEEDSQCNVPQCDLGCCLIGDQGAFVTQTRCKRLSFLYGLEINFRTDFANELDCLASVTSTAKGACVFEEEFEKTCISSIKEDCLKKQGAEFFEGYLCSAETLGTNCVITDKTTCVGGRDEVYFVDSCGNLANIYDSSKANSKEYWTKIRGKQESCNPDAGNTGSSTCGNCNYFLGSTCKEYERGVDDKRAVKGDNICRDLSCEYNGEVYSHGETWCEKGTALKNNLPGSRHFRYVCYNGDVTIEPCEDYRQEICISDDIDGFRTALCRANKWQDCGFQTIQKNCENTDLRDCKWINMGVGSLCVPKFTPGIRFWDSEDSNEICSAGTVSCEVVYEEGIGGGKECVQNCHCKGSWLNKRQEVCKSLGDCEY
jgi:hypothetical protein